jgi:CheY-like chemotaxis protein
MYRILLIDDDADARHILRLILERAGYLVVEAPDGRQGLQRYRDHPADLVITDILMPEQEGLETIRTLRQLDPAVKIVAISGASGTLDFLEVAEKLGAQRMLRKPVDRQALLAAVEALLPEPTA